MIYNYLFEGNDAITEWYKVVEERELYIGTEFVKIKILVSNNGGYHYKNSKHYKGSKQAGPYVSSRNGFGTEEEALTQAIRELTSYYDPNDREALWIENESY